MLVTGLKLTSESYVASPSPDTYHAFVDFGHDHSPVYVSVSKKLTKEQEKHQIEEAKKREQEWLKKHPEAVADRELVTRVKELDEAKNNRDKIDAQIAVLNDTLLDINRQIEQVKSELVKAEDAVTHAEQRRKDAENKAKDEKEKKRKGLVEQGHKYHPAPKTDHLNGFGELKEVRAKTPK